MVKAFLALLLKMLTLIMSLTVVQHVLAEITVPDAIGDALAVLGGLFWALWGASQGPGGPGTRCLHFFVMCFTCLGGPGSSPIDSLRNHY